MKFRHIIYLSLVLLIMGCDKMGLPVHKENGSGSETLTVRVGSANLDTKSAKDGDIMNNLRIWFVKKGETTVKYYSGVINPNASTKEVVFNDVERGDYTMYVLANSTENSAYEQNSTIDEDFKKVTLPELVGNKPPFSDGDGMPMSLIKEVQVTAGNNSISAELVRVCGKIRVTLHNKVLDKKVYLNSFKFTQKNPSNGYLFFNDHAVPAGTTYGDFTSLNATNGSETIAINAGADAVIFDQYLYESGSIDLGLSLAGALYPSDFENTPNFGSTSTQEWQFAGSATNTTIEPGKWYIIANADNPRYFLNDSGSGLAASHGENNDEEFLAAMNADESEYLKYLWTFTSSTSPTSIKNYGTDGTNGKYMSIGNNSFGMSSTSQNVSTDINESTRRFYYDGTGNNDHYIYYDSGIQIHSDGVGLESDPAAIESDFETEFDASPFGAQYFNSEKTIQKLTFGRNNVIDNGELKFGAASTTDNGIPTNRYLSFKVTSPGIIYHKSRSNSNKNKDRGNLVIKIVNGATKTELYNDIKQYEGDNEDILTEIKKEHFQGATQALTVYIYCTENAVNLKSISFKPKNENAAKNRGWYLREIEKVTVAGEAKFNDSGAKNFSHTEEKLKYIDDYGAPTTIDEICRNQILDVHLNVYHRESEGKLYFEVVSWKQPQNGTDKGTTFD